jgi:hypothetical protein
MKTLQDIKKNFEENMLDGDGIDSCGGAILDAKECLEFLIGDFTTLLLDIEGELDKELDASSRRAVDSPRCLGYLPLS